MSWELLQPARAPGSPPPPTLCRDRAEVGAIFFPCWHPGFRTRAVNAGGEMRRENEVRAPTPKTEVEVSTPDTAAAVVADSLPRWRWAGSCSFPCANWVRDLGHPAVIYGVSFSNRS